MGCLGLTQHSLYPTLIRYLPLMTASCPMRGMEKTCHTAHCYDKQHIQRQTASPLVAQNWRAIVILLSDRSLSSGANNVSHHGATTYESHTCQHMCWHSSVFHRSRKQQREQDVQQPKTHCISSFQTNASFVLTLCKAGNDSHNASDSSSIASSSRAERSML